MGEHRWLSVVTPDAPDGTELLLEPNAHAAAKAYQQAIFNDGITTFFVDAIQAEYDRLKSLAVNFNSEPTAAGPVTIAAFDDTCGNLIQLTQWADGERQSVKQNTSTEFGRGVCKVNGIVAQSPNAASKATFDGSKSTFLQNWHDSRAPCSRSMPLSSHSTDNGPPY